MKLFHCLFLLAAPAMAAEPLLDLKNTSGAGLLTKDLTVYDDGAVMCSKLLSSTGKLAPPVKITSLDPDEVISLQASIAAINPAPLVRLNPDQGFNPGGFTTTYTLVHADGVPLVFAKQVSGVDYGFASLQGQDLLKLLQDLSQLGCGR